ncbi:PLAC8-domain-containing protein [Poronia punctata]|nr:PLAC8-domain-containing protein [Poronia punctata]
MSNNNNHTINPNDVEDWKDRFNQVLAQPADYLNSSSPETARSWHNGFFDCFNPIDTCLVTWFLPCVTFGKTHHRLRKDGDLKGWEPINTSCMLFCGSSCFGLYGLMTALQRQDLREKYDLQGNCLVDIATACCCGCCDLAQQEKEAAYWEGMGKGKGKGDQVGYSTNEEMVMPK